MIILKSNREIDIMRKANEITSNVLAKLVEYAKPGISTYELDVLAEKMIREYGAVPAFKGYMGFPASICTSINEEIVHGIPSKKRILKNGDILSIDLGVKYNGYFGDAAVTIGIGKISKLARKLIDVTKSSLYIAIDEIAVGKRIYEISKVIEDYVTSFGFNVIRDFVGHGIGRHLHEEPQIPNYYNPEFSEVIMPGMVLALEPMVSVGTYKVLLKRDNWTAITADRSLSAHFEHSVAVFKDRVEILSLNNNCEYLNNLKDKKVNSKIKEYHG